MQALIDHWELIVSIVVPILTLAGTIGLAAGSYVLKTNEKILSELTVAIAELRTQNKEMCETYQKDIRTFVTHDNCKDDAQNCNAQRDIFRLNIEKKIDELHTDINLQDLKRHENNNKSHIYFLEICERLATVEAFLGIKTQFPTNRGRRTSDVS